MKTPFLTLGTVQFGHPYGIRRNAPLLTTSEVQTSLRQAVNGGIRHFDTAHAYGLAERRLGEARQLGILPADATVITKLPPDLDSDQLEKAVQESLRNLKQDRLDVLMLHRWEQRKAPALWDSLRRMRDAGLLAALGASVYTPEQACEAASDPDVNHLQIPFNILDWRWEASDLPAIREKRTDLTVYARSIYLQGILVSPSSVWPTVPGVNAPAYVQQLEDMAQAVGLHSRQALCFSFAQSQRWIDSLVIGVDSAEQLVDNLRLERMPPMDAAALAKVRNAVPRSPDKLLNPSLWSVGN